jgi:putative zinc finger protein
MTPLGCAAVRRLLDAYHDRELSIEKHIVVDAHLESCAECLRWLEELCLVRSALRASAGRAFSNDDVAVFATTVVSRWKAEQQGSLFSQVASLFDDLHLVYAGLGAAIATAASVVVMLGMMRFATLGRSDSLGAVINFLSIPGAGSNLPVVDNEIETRWTARFRQANAVAEQDAVFALQDVVSKQGRLVTLDRLQSDEDAMRIESLLDGLSRARFRQDFDKAPAAANIVWLVARTTVRPTRPPVMDRDAPARIKRQADSGSTPPPRLV